MDTGVKYKCKRRALKACRTTGPSAKRPNGDPQYDLTSFLRMSLKITTCKKEASQTTVRRVRHTGLEMEGGLRNPHFVLFPDVALRVPI